MYSRVKEWEFRIIIEWVTIIRVNELKKVMCNGHCVGKLKQRWQKMCGKMAKGLEEEWSRFKEKLWKLLKKCVEKKIRETSRWWNKEIRRVDKRKEYFLVWRSTGRKRCLEEFSRMKAVINRGVEVTKKRAKEEWESKMSKTFNENKKSCVYMFVCNFVCVCACP